MKRLFSKSSFALINLAVLAVCCSTLSAKAETGNLPDIGTTANAASQNIDQIFEPVATSAVKLDAETAATNTKIDSISSIELTEAAEPAAAAPSANLPASVVAPSESAATTTSEIAGTETAQIEPASIAAETKNSEETAKISDRVKAQPTVEIAEKLDRPNSEETAKISDSVKVQPTVEIAEKIDRPNLELTAAKEEKEVQTAQEVLSNPVSTSASALTNQPKLAEKPAAVSDKPEILAQPSTIRPGRATRSGPSYIGIGGNLGFGGDSALGDSSFAIISKIGLTNNFSVRPSVLFRDELTFLLPVTYDFVSREAVEVTDDFVITAAPYLGAGVTISTGDNSNFGFLISGGVDVPLSRNFTATAGLNVGFLDGAEVGLLLGVGYTFPNISR
ncbi:outer membrane protein [Tychonema sp. LEGE 07203]|uniref:outer membrane protein n=1 Tax=Tychonema sp. LEGE 07203 TaxID=1828671 RepID=UPI0018827A46|nr:hypothetical protein [Tychonema sp. LEGE 07203]MBE9095458.1 hypothetical protein [Tychonema sp. LEGE 07203]